MGIIGLSTLAFLFRIFRRLHRVMILGGPLVYPLNSVVPISLASGQSSKASMSHLSLFPNKMTASRFL